MKIIYIIAMLTLGFLLTNCGTVEPDSPGNQPSLLEANQILDSVQSRFLYFADKSNGDPKKAIEMTLEWLLMQKNVKIAYSYDSAYIKIILKSGIESNFHFEEVDSEGFSKFRGGGNSEVIQLKDFSGDAIFSKNTIKNKKVLLFASDTKSLPGVKKQISKTVNAINNAGIGLEVTVLKDEQCSYGVVETFGDYGLVIIDGHGSRDYFVVGSINDLSTKKTDAEMKSAINAQKGNGTTDKIISGQLQLGASIKGNSEQPNWQKTVIPSEERTLHFTTKYIDLLPPMPNTVIFGNMCYSGFAITEQKIPGYKHTDENGVTTDVPASTLPINPISKAFVNRGLISYYGYACNNPQGSSRSVPDEFAANSEQSFVERLSNRDSTGLANLGKDNKNELVDYAQPQSGLKEHLYFRRFGADDYSFSNCISKFTDVRDGQEYKVVCVGKQTWMAENLRFNAPGSSCFPGLDCKLFGRLYDWTTVTNGTSSAKIPSGVRGICPQGWHVPSMKEWELLVLSKEVGGISQGGGNLKSMTYWDNPNSGASNKVGFNALPGGMFHFEEKKYFFAGQEAHWWSASSGQNAGKFNFTFINYMSPSVTYNADIDPGYQMSCRCVKD